MCIRDRALDEPRVGPVSDLQERGTELPDAAGRDRTDDLPRRAAVSLPQIAEWDVSHESTNPLRAGFARTVRDIGQHLRDLARSVRGHVEAVADLVRDRAKAPGQDRAEAERDRTLSSAVAAVLQHSDRANHELGAAGERVVGRTVMLLGEREAREREQEREARRERDSGHDYGL